MADFPSTTDASDVWSLKDNYKAEAGDNWPQMPIGITATGGTITTSGDYKYHAFTSSGTFTVSDTGNQGGTVDFLLVAGGGGGGFHRGGGGGAGGYRAFTSQSVSATGYSITIGAGGNGGTSSGVGSNGGNSSALGYTNVGGGYGGHGNDANGNTGGS